MTHSNAVLQMSWRSKWHFTSNKLVKRAAWDESQGERLIEIVGQVKLCVELQQQGAERDPGPAFYLTFNWELTQHITVQLIKRTHFRSSALTAVFQGTGIRSAVTEECLLNKNWRITSWKAGWSWASSPRRLQILTFTLYYSIRFWYIYVCVCFILSN